MAAVDNFDEDDSTRRKQTDLNLKDLETDLCFTNLSGHKPLFALSLMRHTPRCPRVTRSIGVRPSRDDLRDTTPLVLPEKTAVDKLSSTNYIKVY